MTQKEMQLLVPQKLRQIEQEYGIRVLYAAESGSRAWGTASEGSDFDIRFIYIRPWEEYLRLDQTRDVLEFPISEQWDMCGWDLSKTLRLLHNSNTQIYEWFLSPVVYVDTGFSERFCPVLKAFFSERTAVNHYLHQADLKLKKLQKAEIPKVKHYLYVLQHLAAARWVLLHHAPVALGFRNLIELIPDDIRGEAQEIFHRKTTQPDQPLISRMPQLDVQLQEERNHIQREIGLLPQEEAKSWEALNRFFLSELDRM